MINFSSDEWYQPYAEQNPKITETPEPISDTPVQDAPQCTCGTDGEPVSKPETDDADTCHIVIQPPQMETDGFSISIEPSPIAVYCPVPTVAAQAPKARKGKSANSLLDSKNTAIMEVIGKFGLTDPTERDLDPTARKSFYGKGKVIEDGHKVVLVSYYTPIGVYDKDNDVLHKLCGIPSKTTGSHFKAFLVDQGLPPISSMAWESQDADAVLTRDDLNKLI